MFVRLFGHFLLKFYILSPFHNFIPHILGQNFFCSEWYFKLTLLLGALTTMNVHIFSTTLTFIIGF